MNKIHTKLRALPSLAGLRGFESAARLMSFSEAAQELNVTQTAVSHRIKTLETQLGVRLFNRSGKTLTLTDPGKKLLPEASKSFDRLESIISQIKSDSKTPVVTVSVTPSFASKWLIQRLGKFWNRYPDIQLNIHHSIEIANFTNDGVDIAIRGGNGDWPGLVTEIPLSLRLSPIGHPSVLEGKHSLKTPSDLRYHNLLHEDSYEDWALWLAAVGVDDVDPLSGNIMNDINSLGIAVENCQGVALGRWSLIENDLNSGKIVRPFDIEIDSSYASYLLCPKEKADDIGVQAFHDFVLSEVS